MTERMPVFDLCVWWSVYVQAKDMGKAKREHFPPVELIIGPPAVPFEYIREGSGVYRLVAYANYPHAEIRTVIPEILATAYTLENNWRISGLGCLRTGGYSHVSGIWSAEKPSPKAPQLVSMMFEVHRGLAVSMNGDGGVLVTDEIRN